jgi:hypothetical protein
MLHWAQGPKPYDGVWAPWWYANTHKSTGASGHWGWGGGSRCREGGRSRCKQSAFQALRLHGRKGPSLMVMCGRLIGTYTKAQVRRGAEAKGRGEGRGGAGQDSSPLINKYKSIPFVCVCVCECLCVCVCVCNKCVCNKRGQTAQSFSSGFVGNQSSFKPAVHPISNVLSWCACQPVEHPGSKDPWTLHLIQGLACPSGPLLLPPDKCPKQHP